MFNIQNISNGNLFCVLNIYVINKPITRKNVLYTEQYFVNMFNILNIYHKTHTRHEAAEVFSVT